MIIVIMIIAGLIGGFLAQAKGKNVFLWSSVGLLPIAPIILAFMKRETGH